MSIPSFEILFFKNPQNYNLIYQYQIERREKLQQGSANECLYLLEHIPIYTAGRQFHQEHLLLPLEVYKERGISFTNTDRGGDITYHGPGQLVGYPILNLAIRNMTVHQYLRNLEETIIETLHFFGITAHTIKSLTGVWVQDRKIAAIGIGVKNSITWHGFSININLDLTPFQWIVPCGISDKTVTSLQKEINNNYSSTNNNYLCPTINEFIQVFLPTFFNQFNIKDFSFSQIDSTP